MASQFRALYFFVSFLTLLSLVNFTISIPSREFDSMLSLLRVHGYSLFSNAIVTSDIQYDLLFSQNDYAANTSFTFFAPTDASLFALDMTQNAASYTDTLRFHIVPRRLSFIQLQRLPSGSSLPTLLPSRELNVTRRGDTGAVAVGGVDVVMPGLYYGPLVAVHGLSSILSVRSASGSSSPTPLSTHSAVRTSQHPSLAASNAKNHPNLSPVGKIHPVDLTMHGPEPSASILDVQSPPEPAENFGPPMDSFTESPAFGFDHAAARGPNVVSFRTPVNSPSSLDPAPESFTESPANGYDDYAPSTEMHPFTVLSPVDSPISLGPSSQKWTQSPMYDYDLSPELSSAFSMLSDPPVNDHTTIPPQSFPPVTESPRNIEFEVSVPPAEGDSSAWAPVEATFPMIPAVSLMKTENGVHLKQNVEVEVDVQSEPSVGTDTCHTPGTASGFGHVYTNPSYLSNSISMLCEPLQ